MSSKVCFLVLAHTQLPQLERMLMSLNHPKFDVYLHLDKRVKDDIELPANTIRVQPSFRCNWGASSLVEATLTLLRSAFESGVPYRRFSLLSGVDFPVRPNDEIYSTLSGTDSEYLDIYERGQMFRHDWYRKYHFNEWSYWPRRLTHMFLHRMQGRVLPNRKLPMEIEPFWGSQWWSFTHSAVDYILEFMQENPQYLPFFRFTHAPDEMFFHTIIMNSPFREKVEPGYHYIDWTSGGSHPKILDDKDFERFAKDKWLFARKFDFNQSPGLLDRIERELRS